MSCLSLFCGQTRSCQHCLLFSLAQCKSCTKVTDVFGLVQYACWVNALTSITDASCSSGLSHFCHRWFLYSLLAVVISSCIVRVFGFSISFLKLRLSSFHNIFIAPGSIRLSLRTTVQEWFCHHLVIAISHSVC